MFSRSDTRGHISALLSEESKRKRQRSNTINIQMTFISWSLEFIAGVTYLPVRFIKIQSLAMVLIMLDIILNFIFIPMSYVLNNDVNKAIIVAHGWLQGFRRLLSPGSIVVPEQQENGENPGNPDIVPNPIPSVSGNIAVLENRGHRLVNNRLHNTSSGFTPQPLYAVENAVENVPTRRCIDRSESYQNPHEEIGTFHRIEPIALEDHADQIETIYL